jgi:hypothetical protein
MLSTSERAALVGGGPPGTRSILIVATFGGITAAFPFEGPAGTDTILL